MLLVSVSELLVSVSELLVSVSELLVSVSELLVSVSELLVSVSELLVSVSDLLVNDGDLLVSVSEQLVSVLELLVSVSEQLVSESQQLVSVSEQLVSESQQLVSESQQLVSESQQLVSVRCERAARYVGRRAWSAAPVPQPPRRPAAALARPGPQGHLGQVSLESSISASVAEGEGEEEGRPTIRRHSPTLVWADTHQRPADTNPSAEIHEVILLLIRSLLAATYRVCLANQEAPSYVGMNKLCWGQRLRHVLVYPPWRMKCRGWVR